MRIPGNQIIPTFNVSDLNSPVNMEKFQELLANFNEVDQKVENSLRIINSENKRLPYKDLFYIYNLVVNNELYGNKRLTPLFDDYIKAEASIGRDYLNFSTLVDSGKVNVFEIDDVFDETLQEDLKNLIDSGNTINHYIGFEISGLVHLGTGLMSMGKIADFLKAGVKCKIFLADFHSFLNNKLGGKWEDIRWASENYFKEALIASLKCFGVEKDQVEFISGKDLYEKNPVHWQNFMEIGKQVTLSRNLRSISIMGKKQGNDIGQA